MSSFSFSFTQIRCLVRACRAESSRVEPSGAVIIITIRKLPPRCQSGNLEALGNYGRLLPSFLLRFSSSSSSIKLFFFSGCLQPTNGTEIIGGQCVKETCHDNKRYNDRRHDIATFTTTYNQPQLIKQNKNNDARCGEKDKNYSEREAGRRRINWPVTNSQKPFLRLGYCCIVFCFNKKIEK